MRDLICEKKTLHNNHALVSLFIYNGEFNKESRLNLAIFHLAEYLSIKKKLIRIEYGQYGKPLVVEPRGVYISWSYRGNTLITTVANQPLGVDIEELVYLQNPQRFISDHFSTREKLEILKFSDIDLSKVCIKLWTIKEAILKEEGIGIREGVKNPCLAKILTANILSHEIQWQLPYKNKRYIIHSYHWQTNVVSLALCVHY